MSNEFSVTGRIVDGEERPVSGLLVTAFDRHLPSLGPLGEQQLGRDAVTDASGRYEIAFDEKDFRHSETAGRRKSLPDVLIRVFDAGSLLGESKIHFRAPEKLQIDLTVDIPERSEYEALMHQVSPVLEGVSVASLTDDDLAFLEDETRIDENWIQRLGAHAHARPEGIGVHLRQLRQAAGDARRTSLPVEAFYAWASVLDPHFTLEGLAGLPHDQLSGALRKAITAKLIPATFDNKIDGVIQALKRSAFLAYPVALELLDETGAPVAGLTVTIDSPGGENHFGPYVSDGKGIVQFQYFAPPPGSTEPVVLDFVLRLSGPTGASFPDIPVEIQAGKREAVPVRIKRTSPAPSLTITELAGTMGAAFPESLAQFFRKNKINTLEDIRNIGGLRHLPGLPVAGDDSAVRALEAHADLGRLSQDWHVNTALINKGFTSVAQIAETPRSTFVSQVHDVMADFNAARTHAVAQAQTSFLDNLLAGMAANRSGAFTGSGTLDVPNSGFPERCACEDCESAISPAFYLVDLLRYALKSIQVNGANIGLQFLADTFHQPFYALPMSCEAVNQKVRRVRICIEILRAYLGARPLPDPGKEQALEKVERSYLFKAYTALLTQIGTSFDEIRLVRTDTTGNRQALAQRLGIELTNPRPAAGDELDRLFIDTSAGANGPNGLERTVEQLFGLADTFRDPLSDGAKFGDDPNALITRWSLRGAEWGRNTDSDGNVYVSLENPQPMTFEIKLYRDTLRTQLVASSDPTTVTHVPVLPENASGLSGALDVPGGSLPPPGNGVFISAIPNFLSWRLGHLRTIWAQQDRPDDPYSDSAVPKLPLIDPDLIGPDDFRSPVPAGPNAPFDIWLARRGLVDQKLLDIRAAREGPGGLTAALELIFGKPLPDFGGLLKQLTSGSKDEVNAARDAVSKLGLAVDAFVRLMQIRGEDQQARIDPRIQVTGEEWEELYSILTQVNKVRLFDSWRSQEQQAKLLLGFQDFWISFREPAEGVWPPAELPEDGQPQDTPLIDPELQAQPDLPEPVAGQQAIAFWNQRLGDIKAFTAKLASTRENSGFTAMLKLALGDPLPQDLDQLRKDLASSNPAAVSAAQDVITNNLHLTLDGFNTMMTIRDEDAQPDPSKKPAAAEYVQVYTILTRAWKLGTAYPKWISDEKTSFTPESQTASDPFIAYWRARKAVLPRWRSSAEARQAWSQALLARSAPPIIDPDLIGPEYLRDPVAGNVAYDLWTKRGADIASRLTTISQTARTNTNLDALLIQYLGVSGKDLAALRDAGANGQSIKSRLSQLGLTPGAFAALVRVWTLSVNNLPLVDSDWDTVSSILIQSYKTRQYAEWRSEEAASQAAVVLGPDLFQIPPPPTDPLVVVTPLQLPVWRATQQALSAWQDTLQNRIDQQIDTISGIRDAVSAAEGIALEGLRDGLILATQASGSDLKRAASWVTKRFFIDAQAGACQTTTRVEQALETLQGLFESLADEPFDTGVFQFSAGLAAVGSPGGTHVFARGADKALWHTEETGGTWQEWESLGGVLSSDPCVCVRNGNLEVFALLEDAAVWQNTLAGGVWSGWQSLGGSWTSAPAAVSWGGDHLEVVVRGDNWAAWHRRFINGQWNDWESLALIISSAPTVTSRGVERLDIFARGMDNGVWYLPYDHGFSTWVPRGGFFNSGPSAAAAGNLVFVFGQGTDDLMYFDFFADANVEAPNWLNIFPLPPGITLAAAPAGFIAPRNRMDVLARGSDDRLWQGSLLLRPPAPHWSGWSVIGPPPLTLNAPTFETDWKWLGSYATWRASMLVFLYPENLLLPTLRPSSWQTPGFQTLVNNLATGGTLTPEAACQAAREYADYYQDICTLAVEAACQTLTVTFKGDGCQGELDPEAHYLFYLFARGGKTNRLYWAVYNPDDVNADYAQSAWFLVGGSGQETTAAGNLSGILTSASGLIGAAPFVTISGTKVICLFLTAQVAGASKLYLLRFFVDRQEWDSAPIELSPPFAGGSYKILQADLEGVPPALVIRYPNGAAFLARLSADATGWAPGFPAQFVIGDPIGPEILTAIWTNEGDPGDTRSGAIISGLVPDPGGLITGRWQSNSFFLSPLQIAGANILVDPGFYHGAAWLPYSTTMPVNVHPSGTGYEVIVFWGLTVNDIEIPQQSTISSADPTNFGIGDIDDIVPTGGFVPNPEGKSFDTAPRQFVYRVRDPNNTLGQLRPLKPATGSAIIPVPIVFSFPHKYRRCTFGWNQFGFFLQSNVLVEPDVQGPFDIPGEMTSGDLQARRLQIEQVFLQNLSDPQSVLTYLEEAYYFVPIQLALQLESSGEYEAALGWFRTVYDYTAPKGDERKIYYGLKQEESIPETYVRAADWLSDPLNPHGIARTRGNTYTRFTLLSIIRCLLEYADSEFAQDTGEALARARKLYQTAADLLDSDELEQQLGACPSIIDAVFSTGPGRSMRAQLDDLRRRLSRVSEVIRLKKAVAQVKANLAGSGPLEQRVLAARRTATRAEALSARPQPLHDLLTVADDWRRGQLLSLTSAANVQRAVLGIGQEAGKAFDRAVATATGYTPAAASLFGCVPRNPTLETLRNHAELNLTRLRTCRNIAGMKRDVEPYSAPTTVTGVLPAIGSGGQLVIPGSVSLQPTLYRYPVLIDRARQLVQTASQMEAAMLSALEKFDDKAYGLLRARQDLNVAQATFQLSTLKVNQANDGVALANLQRSKVDDQINYFNGLVNESEDSDANSLEQGALVDLDSAAALQRDVSSGSLATVAGSILGGASGAATGAAAGSAVLPGIGTVVGGIAGAVFGAALGAESSQATSDLAQASSLSTDASASLLRASFERRKQEWQNQLNLANDDAAIGDQQIVIANDDVKIASAEQAIANLQQTNAQDTVAFLTNEFTNPDLYSFMSGVLGRVYSFFLRQATGMAKLAENQLAFERQETPLGVIQADYWAPPTDMRSGNSPADRKGLTGAERLMEDITQLDQYAFLTDKRKLQLSKVFSLGRLAPTEFQRFRETGVMTFSTPMELFDRDFPGHYLRLIKIIRTSVIALIPPNQGISATLSSSGLSRVVIGGNFFQTIPIRRDPESVAFSATVGASGAFDLTSQSSGIFLPFENTGVDSNWEFRMERASNLFDYSTIADVLFTIEYTALNNTEYRQQVIQSLNPELVTDRPFSFRNQFADQWYDLHNPDQTPTPMAVQFTTSRDDFPPNLDGLSIQQVVLYFSRADGPSFEVPVTSLRFKEKGAAGSLGGGAVSIDGVISTRRGNAGSWIPMIGRSPVGDWELALPDNDEIRNHFTNDDIQDILFVLTYAGRTLQWQP